MFSSLTPLSYYEDWILLIVRLIAGVTMVYYGQFKLRDLRKNGENFVEMGFRPGIFWGTIVAVVEFFGGIAILLGVYVWLPAALFGFQMLMGTRWKIRKAKKPFTDWSYDLLLLAIMLMLLVFGGGTYALLG